MPRLRVTRFLSLPLCLAVAGMLPERAAGQSADASYGGNYGLLRPTLHGNAGNPPRFRKPSRGESAAVGQIPTFGRPAAAGAGLTGFNATNAARRKARTPASTGHHITAPGTPAPLPPPPATAQAAPALPAIPAVPDQPSSPSPTTVAARAATVSTRIGGPAVAGGIPDALASGAPPRRRPLPDPDPFGPVGIRAGSLMLRPAIEVTAGYDSNPARAPAGSPGSRVLLVAPELAVQSDWSRHEFDALIRGSFTSVQQDSSLNRPYADARANGRIDLSPRDRIDLQGRLLLSTDYPGSPNVPAGIAKLPQYTDVGATAGVGHTFNRLDVSLKGSLDRIAYQDSLLTDGSTFSNKDRDYTQTGAQLRGVYEFNPGFKPFAAVDTFTRTHEINTDRAGFQRDSHAVTPRVGAAVDWGGTLKGEMSAGYIIQTYKDPALADLRGMVVDGSLAWAATPLTTATVTAQSFSNESVLAGVSGTLVQTYALQVDHAFRRWLIGTARISDEKDTYVGSDRLDHRYIASLGVAYKVTRTLQIKGEVRREWLQSSFASNDYTANVFLVGMRLQR